MSLSAATRAQMDTDVARVRQAFASARGAVEGAASGFFSDDAAQAVLKQYRDQTVTLEKWAGLWRQWAEANKDAAGKAYPVEFWRQVGQDLANFAAFAGKQAGYTLLSTVVKDTVKETGATLVDPAKWSGTVQLLAAAVAAVLLLGIVLRVAK